MGSETDLKGLSDRVTADRQREQQQERLFGRLDAEVEQLGAPLPVLDSPIIDALAWHAPARATGGLRRAAILIWGIGYLGTGRGFLMVALQRRSIFEAAVAAILFAVGTRVVLNSATSERRHPTSP